MELDPVNSRDKKPVTSRLHPRLHRLATVYIALVSPDASFSEYIAGLIEDDVDRAAAEDPRVQEAFDISDSIQESPEA